MNRLILVPEAKAFDVSAVMEQFVEILPLTEGAKSRVGIRYDRTISPILNVLAWAKYGPYDQREFIPLFKDGDPNNEDPSNIGLAFKSHLFSSGKKSGIDYRAGTPEYQREYQRKRRDKAREDRKKVEQMEKGNELQKTQAMQEHLAQLFPETQAKP